jgi:hypothetical protein
MKITTPLLDKLRAVANKKNRKMNFRTIVILVVVILILLYLIFMFGLGGGNGTFLPGGGNGNGIIAIDENNNAKTETSKTESEKTETNVNNTELQNLPEDVEVVLLKFEMIISFESDPVNIDSVREFACNIEKVETRNRGVIQQNKKSIVCDNMSDFEFAVEKEIREWRLSFDLVGVKLLDSSVVPVLNIHMNPFPGEGVFRKIESITKSIDPKINIMRSEN